MQPSCAANRNLMSDALMSINQTDAQALRPLEPQLLDTCVLQNLDWIDRQLEPTGSVIWDEAATAKLVQRFGVDLAYDLLDLGTLYKRFEYDGHYPWLVCNGAVDEAGLLRGEKGERLGQMIEFLAGHQNDWGHDAYPGISQGLLLTEKPGRVTPLMLRALGVTSAEQVHDARGPLAFLPDRGDRLIAAHALLSNIPIVLTTDRKTFWQCRGQLAQFGLEVVRPGELLERYERYWSAKFAQPR